MARELRFAVGTADAVQSTVWRLWANKGDLYLAGRSFSAQLKISFHESGICRLAQVSTQPRTALANWYRQKRTEPGVIPLFAIYVPHFDVKDAFRDKLPPAGKPTRLIAPATSKRKKAVVYIIATEPNPDATFTLEPRRPTYSVLGTLNLTNEIVWALSFEDEFTSDEEKIARDKLLEIKTDFGHQPFINFAVAHSVQTKTVPPAILDLQLGPEHFGQS